MPSHVPCDICGATEQRLLFDRGRDGPLSAVVCQRCGFVFLSPRPDTAAIQQVYTGGDFSVQARGARQPTPTKIDQLERAALPRYRLLHKHLSPDAPPGQALEIGCGIGSFLRLLRGRGWQVAGLEPDPDYAAFGSNFYQLPIAPQLYEDAPAPPAPYDLIASFHVIEHVVSPRAFVAKAWHELAPGGLLYLETPCIEKPYGGDLERFFWGVHLSAFSQRTLGGLLANVGFAPHAAGYVGDFVWVLARKVAQPTPLALPLDDPAAVYAQTHAAYAQHKLRTASLAGKVLTRAPAWAELAAHKLSHDPAGVLPAVGKRARAWGERRGLHWKLPGPPPVVHVGLHTPGNAGDTLLFAAVRQAFDTLAPQRWVREPLRAPVTPAKIGTWNQHARAVVVGGGGLFLRDTNANQASGWQWACSVEDLHRLRVPLVLFAVGYNRFRGQEDFDAVFVENVRAIVQHAAFVGLRNHGSLRRLAAYLPPELAAKLAYQPCPTTVLRYLYPDLLAAQQLASRRLALNIAFDRHHLRFQGRENEVLDTIARTMKQAERDGWQIDLVLHIPQDATVAPWLERHAVRYRTVNLCGVPAEDVITYYRDTPLTVGMRGHSQMIPFGVGNAIISLISHDKLGWFLDDITHPEWGIELLAPDLGAVLHQAITTIGADLPAVRQQVAAAQERLWAITRQNILSCLPIGQTTTLEQQPT